MYSPTVLQHVIESRNPGEVHFLGSDVIVSK